MTRKIEPEGPRDAKIAFFGESPWKTEESEGRPFAGPSGRMWERILEKAGLYREDIYIDNAYPFKPPGNPPMGDRLVTVPTDQLIYWMGKMHERIANLDNVKVIVPTGNYATYALIGKGKVAARVYKELGREVNATEAEKKAGIVSLRGSVYEYIDLLGRRLKVIPTIHPAAIMAMRGWEGRTIGDWKRIKEQSEWDEWPVKERRIITYPTIKDWENFYKRVVDDPNLPISIDIETSSNITCVGFACEDSEATVFPMENTAQREGWMPYVKAICELPHAKIAQNGLYDAYWLAWAGVRMVNFIWDPMCIQHCLNPRDSLGLGYLASIYTYQPFWKDEAKDSVEILKHGTPMAALYHYNGLDCCLPVEIVRKQLVELNRRGLIGFYLKHYAEMFEPMLDMMLQGIRVNVPKQKEFAKAILGRGDLIRQEVKGIAGKELFATKDKIEYREPSKGEWVRLLMPDWWRDAGGAYPEEPPKIKYINREAAKALGYVMNRGFIKYKVAVPQKSFSGDKVVGWFGDQGVRLRVKWKKKKASIDEVVLLKLAMKHRKKLGKVPLLIVEHRHLQKEHEKVNNSWDKDGRIRCSYGLCTEAGRFKSSKNPKRKGYNLQNVKKG